MTRKALGRGLSALLGEAETPVAGLEQVPLDLIDPSPFQPRRAFPEATLKELADSIRASGLVQPVLLRRSDGRYQLVAGERRWRAARLAGLPAIPAVVRDLSEQEALTLSLTENLMREDLNPLEVAHAYNALQERFQLSHEEIAERLGVNRSTVTNTVRLLRLTPRVQELLAGGELSAGHARALLAVESAAAQAQLARMIIKQGLSVRQVEDIVSLREANVPSRKVASTVTKLDPNTRAAVLELERTLGTRVRIVGTAKRGTIEISYFSPEDLNRLFEWIVRR
jgi:ParB family chromosome partitioning protein